MLILTFNILFRIKCKEKTRILSFSRQWFTDDDNKNERWIDLFEKKKTIVVYMRFWKKHLRNRCRWVYIFHWFKEVSIRNQRQKNDSLLVSIYHVVQDDSTSCRSSSKSSTSNICFQYSIFNVSWIRMKSNV